MNIVLLPQPNRPSGSDTIYLHKNTHKSIPHHHFGIEEKTFMIASYDYAMPKLVEEALSCPAKEEWKKAMVKEMESMKVNYILDLVDLPSNHKAIENKWVLKIKRNVDGSIERCKARLGTKGYTQQEDIDYEEAFSLVVRFVSIHLILAIVTHLNLELHQMDIKTTFINGELDKKIYMRQPIGFVVKGQERKFCKLQQSIYALK